MHNRWRFFLNSSKLFKIVKWPTIVQNCPNILKPSKRVQNCPMVHNCPKWSNMVQYYQKCSNALIWSETVQTVQKGAKKVSNSLMVLKGLLTPRGYGLFSSENYVVEECLNFL